MKYIFRKAILCMASLLIISSVCAQDIIVTTDARKIEAKILEVSLTEIKYKEMDNLDGPTFILGTNNINSIIYANGKVVVYVQEKPQEAQQQSSQTNDEELKAWIEESNRKAEQERQAKYNEERLRQAREEERLERLQEQMRESGEQLGQAIRGLIEVENSYILEIQNSTKYPYRINLDGRILGVVNPYKVQRYRLSLEQYGRMQAVQTSGYTFSPTIKEYRIPKQQKKGTLRVQIQ